MGRVRRTSHNKGNGVGVEGGAMRRRRLVNLLGFLESNRTLLVFGLVLVAVASFTTCKASQALEFTIEPQDVVVPEGHSVLLQCAGSVQPGALKEGKTAPNIRWRGPDGQELGIVGDTFRNQLKNGSLYISSVEENRGLTGSYQCLLNVDGIGTIVSRSATVSIARLPEIDQDFMELYLLPGQTAYFRCMIAPIQSGIKHHVQWLKDDAPLHFDTMRMVILPSGALEIDEVSNSDRGTYQCNVTSGTISRLSSKKNLNIKKSQGQSESLAAPQFQIGPSPQTVKEGDTVTFECVANGNPKPQIRWLRKGEEIDMNDLDSRFSIIGTGSLQISSAEDTDSDNYQCRASNSVDSLDAQATLQVQVPPKFIQSPVDKVAYEKEELELGCSIRGKPKPVIKWLKNGDVITPNDYMQIVGGHNLRILGLLNSDAGMFQCVGSNPAGSVQASARLKIIEPDQHHKLDDTHLAKVPLPGAPRDLEAQIVKPRFVALSWMEPIKNPDEVVSYSVYYKMHTSDRERKITTKSRDDQQVNIQSLLPGKIYQFRVVGNSNHGPGESSEVLEVSTQPEENIAGPPTNVEGLALSHNSILVKWDPPLVTNGVITKYRIYYAENDSGDMYTDSTSPNLEAELTELRPFTEYTISVVPFNQNGMGDPSNEIKIKTFSSTPSEPPSNVTLEVTSSTSITVHWEPPPEEERNGQITGYKIRYRKLRESPQVKTTPANVRHFELNNLDRMSEYQVKIAAMTVNGSGPFSEWFRVLTYENDLDETQVPGKPRWITVRAGAQSIALHWAPPAQQDIKIRSYILGWGKGVPDDNTQELNENIRYFELKNLEPNTEYVLSLRARNIKGDGPPIYDNVKTRDEEPLDVPAPLQVPVGLRAITMSPNSIVVYWTDMTLSKSQQVTDNRHYTVRYGVSGSNRYRNHNTTDLNTMIGDLKPNTQYEFAVKVVKGRRESAWSMSVLNTTLPNIPLSPPRNFTVQSDGTNPQNVILQWQPPKHNIGMINGYVIYYTTDLTKRDRDWDDESVDEGVHMKIIENLKPFTTYYFKIQAKNSKGYSPFSAMVTYKTGTAVLMQDSSIMGGGVNNQMIIIIIAGATAVTLIIAIVIILLLCRRKVPSTPDHTKKSYQKNNAGIPKPPDLWIHHDQMELKNVEKGHHHTNSTHVSACSDGASSSGAMTLPRSVVHEYDSDPALPHVTNSLDKRSYVPGYMTTSMNSTMERPQYPRTQYNMSSRSHINVDAALSQQSLNQPQNNSLAQTPENPYAYDSMPSNYSNASVTYAPGMSVEVPKRGQGHPLKSFSVPGPPPPNISTPIITNPNKHSVPAVTIRPQNASPYKKASFSSLTPTNRLQSGPSVAHSNDEIQRLAPSTSTEELNQEMANLEGLMKDLSAITANEFEC
ncbi:neogenin isoform X2 [Hermetia illucens]|uniref:neogenin isoform X2 n=1 Tax=Hermetia illucens TaxID=343691 RepID=UPI0018CC1853|nr:neogenin isoform X2 [Hermetia illucens]